ncbi:hypothetical protein HELRODRAFT_183207 [Helobdella robusta]|uniref:G-protein coupled receptors family 1 profile domain-containing protein n=1 Tax=Helobdella robusta TaxID=6412 RepID=T1FJB2_HELRO|nr:hypothetical protein HELRODRAFT_183207 [Helobdella robusta]ESO11421.1 hypothetical protein HELRODRAFT_183207 [Helobdella robusta]
MEKNSFSKRGERNFFLKRYLEYNITSDGTLERSDTAKNLIYRYFYASTLYALLFFILPLLALAYLNARLIIALRRGKRHWLNLKSTQRREQNLTIIPLTVVLVFVVCATPALVVNVLDSYDQEIFEYSTAFLVTSNFLIVISSASNIIIYFLLGSSFRRRLCEMFHCGQAASHHLQQRQQRFREFSCARSSTIYMTNTNTNNSNNAPLTTNKHSGKAAAITSTTSATNSCSITNNATVDRDNDVEREDFMGGFPKKRTLASWFNTLKDNNKRSECSLKLSLM